MYNVKYLEQWYASRCNGDWEHGFGIQLHTLDNPGWWLRIDLNGTPWEDAFLPTVQIDRGDHDWMNYKIEGGIFEASGSVDKLDEMIQAFRNFVETG